MQFILIVNDPSGVNRFWTVELAFPFDKLVLHQEHIGIPPKHNDQWVFFFLLFFYMIIFFQL